MEWLFKAWNANNYNTGPAYWAEELCYGMREAFRMYVIKSKEEVKLINAQTEMIKIEIDSIKNKPK